MGSGHREWQRWRRRRLGIVLAVATIVASAAPAAAANATSPPWSPSLGYTYNWAYTSCSSCGEWGIDVPLPLNTPVMAPESGTVINYEPAGRPCYDWTPGRLLFQLDRGGVIGFGHVTRYSGVSVGEHVGAGTEIATIGPTPSCDGGDHVEFMYAPGGCSSGSSCYVHTDFRCTPGCGSGTEYPLSDPLSPWTLLKSYFNPTAVELHGAVALIPGGGGAGYSLDGFGGLHPFGGAPAVTASTGSWKGWDIARSVAIAPNSTRTAVTGYVLDGYGGIHPFAAGSAALPPGVRTGPYWSGWDIARGIVLSTPTSGYVLDGWGGIHPFAAGSTVVPPNVSVTGYWKGWDIARALVLSTPTSGYVLDGYGGLHPFAGGGENLPRAPDGRAAYWKGWDIARSITLASPDTGYVLDGYGGIHAFAPAGVSLPPNPGSPGYSAGSDIYKGIAFDPASGGGADVKAYLSDGSGGAAYTFTEPRTRAHTAVALIPGGGGAGYLVDGYGRLHAFGGAPRVSRSTGSWPGWDIVRGLAISPASTKRAVTGYVLDGYGGIHPFAAGRASLPPKERSGPYWAGWDIARAIVLSTPRSGYLLDGFGGIHPFATGRAPLPAAERAGPYWAGWDIARDIVLSTPTSGYLLDGYGGIHPFAAGRTSLPRAPDKRAAYWPGWDIARGIALVSRDTGYVLDGYGGLHPFAPRGIRLPPHSGKVLYWGGWDVFDSIAYDRATGTGVDVNVTYLDGSGGTRSTFHGPRTR